MHFSDVWGPFKKVTAVVLLGESENQNHLGICNGSEKNSEIMRKRMELCVKKECKIIKGSLR